MRLLIRLSLCSAALIMAGCSKEPVSVTKFMFDTKCSIVIPSGEKNAKQAIVDAYSRLAEIDAKFNLTSSSSPIYQFNTWGKPIRDREIIKVAKYMFRVREESGGALEPRIYPLVKLWNFYGEHPVLPKDKDIKAVMPLLTGKLSISEEQISPGQKGVGLDFGSIIPGYAADEAVRVLKEHGIRNALVDTGGELYALGRIDGRKWRIGLKNPRAEGMAGIIEAENEGVSTAGTYEKYVEVNGKRYSHILDPRTGYSPQGIDSVTIICPTAFEADAWDTAIVVLGLDKGLKKISTQPGLKAVIIDSNGKLHFSPGAGKQFHISS